tara:strand:+ start:3124 stop:3498 length:375 start_codon:yes stop_codon:yes gene_type:complete
MLWEQFGPCVRVAGSGSTPKPAPDLLASNGGRCVAIECKAIKGEKRYFDYSELMQLKLFADNFGAEPWVGVRFDKLGWWFVKVDKIRKSKGESFLVSLSRVKKEGLKFEEFIGKYRQKRLVSIQ